MIRNIQLLANKSYDVLVIGGGIHGACVAWDASLRGLTVALVDRGDFGHATSANSLKIIHGGLRYLQDGNLRLMRDMIRERAIWMRIAPHLVFPLPFVFPTDRTFGRNKLSMSIAMKFNDLAGIGINPSAPHPRHIPHSCILNKDEFQKNYKLPLIKQNTGFALWHDCQVYNSERLLLSILLSATHAGADVTNYVKVTGFFREGNTVMGVRAEDQLNGQEIAIQARLTINCAGVWWESLMQMVDGYIPSHNLVPSTAMNIITRQIHRDFALGIPTVNETKDMGGRVFQRSRTLFIVPWKDFSIIGTIHLPLDGDVDRYRVDEHQVQSLIDEVNTAYPFANLEREDVHKIHSGFLPAIQTKKQQDEVKLLRQGKIIDHSKSDSIEGIISVIGVKYTTARLVAQKAVDLALHKLGRKSPPCETHETPIKGGDIDHFEEYLIRALRENGSTLHHAIIQRLVHNYGSGYHKILEYLQPGTNYGETISERSSILKAEIVHAIRREMALKLSDVVHRRTELGAAGLPEEHEIFICADFMANELGWGQLQKKKEMEEVCTAYSL